MSYCSSWNFRRNLPPSTLSKCESTGTNIQRQELDWRWISSMQQSTCSNGECKEKTYFQCAWPVPLCPFLWQQRPFPRREGKGKRENVNLIDCTALSFFKIMTLPPNRTVKQTLFIPKICSHEDRMNCFHPSHAAVFGFFFFSMSTINSSFDGGASYLKTERISSGPTNIVSAEKEMKKWRNEKRKERALAWVFSSSLFQVPFTISSWKKKKLLTHTRVPTDIGGRS